MQMLEKSSCHEGRDLRVDAVGQRVVHGGEQFRGPVVIDNGVVAAIDRLEDSPAMRRAGVTFAMRIFLKTEEPAVHLRAACSAIHLPHRPL